VVLLGDDELAAGEVTVKDFASGEQRRVARAGVGALLVERAGRPRAHAPEGS
jgi:histidyl-tRNA synthetase